MSARNLMIFYFGILLIPSIKQILTMSQCDEKKGDCVDDYKRETDYYCKKECFRKPGDCENYVGVDLFGKNQKYQCHCKLLSDCKFGNFSECKNGCLPGFKQPYCQKRRYHEFIKNDSNESPYLFSSDNKKAKKPRFIVHFRNTYRFSTVEIYSNFTDATMKVSYPSGMECESKTNKTVCTGNVKSKQLEINGKAGVYRIKLFGCPPGLYGKDCINECHCSRLEPCHPITGVCRYDCEDGWYGEKCDKQTYVNIAQSQTTYQTSTYGETGTTVFHNGTCKEMKIPMKSDNAVDGNFDPGFIHKSCASTNWERNPYWDVTLDKLYTISQLIIYNRMGNHLWRLSGFKVYVGDSLCYQSSGYEYNKTVIHIECNQPYKSNFVRIMLDGYKRMLTLCEVEVLQCVTGFYGKMCKERCDECKDSKCDQFKGRCEEGCSTGYSWSDHYQECRKCYSGKFGDDCKMSCHCSKTCNHINGSCPGVCDAGYKGFNCQEECEVGKFGSNCKFACHCIDNENCDKKNGYCSNGCADGYKGNFCEHECPNGTFGQNCSKSCGHCSLRCNHVDGSCPGDCEAGYSGINCQEECKGDRFGINCKSLCHCRDNRECDRKNGTCPNGCANGYEGDSCQQVKTSKNILVFVLVPLLLLVILAMGISAAIWCWKKKQIENHTCSEAIPDDTAHIYEAIQMTEGEGSNIENVSCLSKSNLQNFVAQKKQEVEPFQFEFLKLPQTLPMSYTEAAKPENRKKNLDNVILPYDHSRVKLQPDEISSSDYINANFICNQRYVACQGPTQSTLTDFWRMIWQLKCNTIILLNDTVTAGEMKCMQYWPDEENTELFGTIQVTHINTSYHLTHIHRCFTISKESDHSPTSDYQNENESWTINQFFFNKWSDNNIPHAEYILEFRNALKGKQEMTYPLVVHCSAGVGRTGTYICIETILHEMLNSDDIDVLACIRKLREDRMHMVQKRIQLEFIYDVLVENILTGDYDIDVSNIPEEFSRIKETDNSTRVSILEHQFQDVINQVQLHDMMSITLKQEELANFNLSGAFIDGPLCESEFLLMETPKEGKTVYFLKYLINKGYFNIVSFLDPSGDPPNYLPKTLNESIKLGQFLLELVSVEEKDICICSVLKVRFHNKKKSRIEEYKINHFMVTIWVDENYPSCADVLNLSNILSKHQNEQFNKKITIHTSDNFYKSGLLCIIQILKDAITSQSVINIVRLVRLIKKIEPKIVPDCESYAYIWKVAEYLQKESSLYTNFVH